MTWTNTPNRYGDISQTIHWLSMFLVGSAWLLGFFGDELPKGEIREAGESLHISAGEMIGALLILRLIWLVVSPPPKTIPLPIGQIGRYAAKIVHYSLYALLFGVVATGITLVFAEGEPLKFIGFYEISSPWIEDRAFAHSVTARYHHGIDCYLKKSWEEAMDAFRDAQSILNPKEDKPSSIMAERCRKYQLNPPSEEWNGVYRYEEK